MVELDPDWATAISRHTGNFPDSYGIVDVETTGFRHDDVVLQIGQVIVRDHKIVHALSVYIDWVSGGYVTEAWLRGRITETQAQMAANGSVYRMNADTVLEQGQPPKAVFHEFMENVAALDRSEWGLMGHNIQQFDMPRIAMHTKYLLQAVPQFNADMVFDTGALEKGRQLNMAPHHGESTAEWAMRVLKVRAKGVKWKLDTHCAEVHDLWTKSGLSPLDAHDAMSDCILTHYLFESFRDLVEKYGKKEGQ